jgi:hypothetical protein
MMVNRVINRIGLARGCEDEEWSDDDIKRLFTVTKAGRHVRK